MKKKMNRAQVFGTLILASVVGFEVFNFATSEFSLFNLIGEVRFMGFKWASILAAGLCLIDFAGLARLFLPEKGVREEGDMGTWYLMGGWFVAATLNACLTWWAIVLVMAGNPNLGNELVDRERLLSVVPVVVAFATWLIRILIIGRFAISGTGILSWARGRISRFGLEWLGSK